MIKIPMITFLLFLFTSFIFASEEDVKLVEKFNASVSSVNTIIAEVYNEGSKSENGLVAKSTGMLFFERPRYFRMTNSSANGLLHRPVSDLGSNDNLFWFWSTRLKPSFQYYGQYTELYKCNIQGAMNPIWMMEILGVQKITYGDKTVFQHTHYDMLSIITFTKAPNGQEVIKVTNLNTKYNAIASHVLYDSNKQRIASAKILGLKKVNDVYLPAHIDISWPTSKIDITVYLKNIIVNRSIDSSKWIMPNLDKKKNLAE